MFYHLNFHNHVYSSMTYSLWFSESNM
jgi:hypothetical protein